MSHNAINLLVIAFVAVVLFIAIWSLRRHLRKNLKATIVLTMAALIFIITTVSLVKTYRDYQDYLINIASHEVITSNIIVALFLDFSVLMIGGLFLYVANLLYLSDFVEPEAKKSISESLSEQKQSSKQTRHSLD